VRRECRSIANGAGESRFGEIAPVERLAPILAASSPGPRIAFLDEDAGHVLAIDEDPRERASVAVGPFWVRIPPDVDRSRAEQLLQAPLRQDRETALGLAFRVPDLSRVDALQPDTLFIRADGVV
jgi:hypothetical protein